MYARIFEPKKEYQEQVATEFQRLAKKYKFADSEQLRNLFVAYNDFSTEAKTATNWAAAKEVERSIKGKYSVVWDILTLFSSSVVFYYSDFDITINENRGISKLIADSYYSVLKKYDELKYFTRENIDLKFDSKENLDKNYAGSFFYYSR